MAHGADKPGEPDRDEVPAAMDDDGDALAPGERRCIVTRERFPRSRLIRFVIDPDGQVVPDVDERLPGRGLWLSPGRDMVEMAASRRAFARAARRAVIVPADLADRVEALLVRRCLNILSLARRGGQVVTGFEKVRARLRDGTVGVVLSASDGAIDGRTKVVALAGALARTSGGESPFDSDSAGVGTKDRLGDRLENRPGNRVGGHRARRGPRRPEPMLVTAFTAAELGRPLGRDRAVHVSLDSGRLATRLLESCKLLAGFRADPVVEPISMARPSVPERNTAKGAVSRGGVPPQEPPG